MGPACNSTLRALDLDTNAITGAAQQTACLRQSEQEPTVRRTIFFSRHPRPFGVHKEPHIPKTTNNSRGIAGQPPVATRKSQVSRIVSHDCVSDAAPSVDAEARREEPFITLLTQLLDRPQVQRVYTTTPLKSCVRETQTRTKKQVTFHPGTVEPTPTLHAAKHYVVKELAVQNAQGNWIFPRENWAWMRRQSRANNQIAQDLATDLEDDVWVSWRDWKYGAEIATRPKTAAPGAAKHDNCINIGSMRFLIDTGCGHNLIASRYRGPLQGTRFSERCGPTTTWW